MTDAYNIGRSLRGMPQPTRSSGRKNVRRTVGGFDRERDDFYPTPAPLTRALLELERFDDDVWECACGDGAISREFAYHGAGLGAVPKIINTDLVYRGFGRGGVDFLMEQKLLAPIIVTNPPFKLWRQFVAHAVALGATKVVMLGRLLNLEGKANAALMQSHGLARVLVPDYGFNGVLGVNRWQDPAGTVISESRPTNGNFAVADPRIDGHAKSVQLGVRRWHEPAGVVTGKMFAGGGPNAVADPRYRNGKPHFNNVYRIVRWNGAAGTVTAGAGPSSGGQAVADPRPGERRDYKQTKYRVTRYDEPAGTVISASTTGNGAFCVADPRPGGLNARREAYMTGGHYGVLPWSRPANVVSAHGQYDNGFNSVADPRAAEGVPVDGLPAANERLVCVIRSLDDTWHRPFTTAELAALQGLMDPEETLELEGLSDSDWRERIGNAVPPPAAKAVASVMGRTLLMAWSGQSFMLSSEPIWVQPIALALSVQQ